jgi:hypothetical protein
MGSPAGLSCNGTVECKSAKKLFAHERLPPLVLFILRYSHEVGILALQFVLLFSIVRLNCPATHKNRVFVGIHVVSA